MFYDEASNNAIEFNVGQTLTLHTRFRSQPSSPVGGWDYWSDAECAAQMWLGDESLEEDLRGTILRVGLVRAQGEDRAKWGKSVYHGLDIYAGAAAGAPRDLSFVIKGLWDGGLFDVGQGPHDLTLSDGNPANNGYYMLSLRITKTIIPDQFNVHVTWVGCADSTSLVGSYTINDNLLYNAERVVAGFESGTAGGENWAPNGLGIWIDSFSCIRTL